jgi:hypothetical protein
MSSRATKKDILRDARALADFSNLKADDGFLRVFRRNNPGFAPKAFWEHQYIEEGGTSYRASNPEEPKPGDPWVRTEIRRPSWLQTQKLLRIYWKKLSTLSTRDDDVLGATVFDLMKLIKSVTEVGPMRLLQHMYPSTRVPILRAFVFLSENAWRAKFCPQCKQRFVAPKPSAKFCNEVCSGKSRRRSDSTERGKARKMSWWTKPGGGRDQRRAKRRKERREKRRAARR